MEWQSIETAPKDGTDVLICGGIYWCEFLPCEFPSRAFKGSTMAWFDDSIYPNGVWVREETYYQPTYWMPLPPPPKDEHATK